MAKNVNHVSLIKSTNTAMTSGDSVFIASGQTGPKLPTPDVLIQGEIAVNLAKGVETLSIKNTDNEIVTFSSDKIIKKVIVDNERITAAALNDLEVNKQDVLTPGSGISIVNNVISSTVEGITVDDALSSTSENPVQNKVINNALSNKVNNATYAAYTANTASILSGKQDTMSAGTNISIDDNVISTTFDIDTELSSSSTNPVANSAITKVIEENELITAAALNDLEERKLDASAYTPTDLSDLYALSAVVSANSVVTAAALNDLNTRILPTITGVSFNEQLAYVDGGVAYLDDISAHTHAISEVDGLQASLNSKVSGITVNNANKVTPTNGVANLTINANTVGALPTGTTLDGIPDGTNRKLTDYATTIEYYSSGSTHEIRLKNGSTTLATVNANDFIKDGMVDGVTVDEPTSGQNSGVTCLIVTFNTDAGKEDIEIPLSQIFDSSLYYTKVEIDNKLGSGFTGENSGNTVTKVIEDNELAISAALNDLNDRKLDASAYTPTDLSDLYALSGKVDDNAFVAAAALNDLNERVSNKLDASAYTQVEVDFELNSGSTNPVANSAITTTILQNEEVVAEALADLDSRISGNTTYITQVNAKADTIARSLSGYTPSGYSYSKGEVEVKLNDKLDASAYTPTDLSGYYTKQEIDEDKLGSGFTGANSGITVTQAINETETVVSAALNDLNGRIESLDGDIETLESAIQNIDIPTIDGDSDLWSSGSTGVPATSALTEVLEEIETVTATALNDLNDRLENVSDDVADLTEFIENFNPDVDSELDLTSENPVANSAITAALNDKQDKLTIDGDVSLWSSGSTGVPATSALSEVLEEFEEVASTAINNLNDRVSELEVTPDYYVAAGSYDNANGVLTLQHAVHVSGQTYSDNLVGPTVTISGLPVNAGSGMFAPADYNTLTPAIAGTVYGSCSTASATTAKTASASGFKLNSGSLACIYFSNDVTGPSSLNINSTGARDIYYRGAALPSNSDLIKAGDRVLFSYNGRYNIIAIDRAAVSGTTGGGGTDANAISGVSFNGTDATVTNGKAAISATTFDDIVNSSTSASTTADGLYRYYQYANGYSDTGILFIDREYQGGPQVGVTTKEVLTTQDVTKLHNLPSANDLTAHIENPDIHVTSAEKSTWNGKQDAFSNASVLSGISSEAIEFWDNGGLKAHDHSNKSALDNLTQTVIDNSHTHNNKSVLDGITSAKVTQWNNAISGVSFNGTTATVNNHVAAITATIPAAANNATITLQFGNSSSAFTVDASSNLTINLATLIGIPAPTTDDNGKILGVVNGQIAWVTPTTIYTGTNTPSSSQGNDGDIYLQTS